MRKLRVSPKATARILLNQFKADKLTKSEAERISYALENCGVKDATTRLVAGYARLLLTEVTE